MEGERKTGHLSLKDRKPLVKTDRERYFLTFCTVLLLFCVNLRVVMQYINLLLQDENLSLVYLWKCCVFKALIFSNFHQTLLASSELLGVTVALSARTENEVNKSVIFLFSSCPFFHIPSASHFYLPNCYFVFSIVLFVRQTPSLRKCFHSLFLVLTFVSPSPRFLYSPQLYSNAPLLTGFECFWIFYLISWNEAFPGIVL